MQQSVKPISRQSLAERVADELRDLVLLEKLEPGSTIPERETAEALGVSRTPLRESLRILAAEGLVDIAPNRPPTVANPTVDELASLLEVLGSLESLAGELACVNASDEAIDKIIGLEQQMQNTSDSSEPLAFFQLDMQFHQHIVAGSGNEPLMQVHQTFNARLWRARFISSRQRVNRPGTLKQHRNIVKALQKRDAGRCSLALKTHLQAGFKNIKSTLNPEGNDKRQGNHSVVADNKQKKGRCGAASGPAQNNTVDKTKSSTSVNSKAKKQTSKSTSKGRGHAK